MANDQIEQNRGNTIAAAKGENREYYDGGSERVLNDLVGKCYKNMIADLTSSLKLFAETYHAEHCPPIPFVVCQGLVCKKAKEAIDQAIRIVAGGADDQI